jgi:hypothetical protein
MGSTATTASIEVHTAGSGSGPFTRITDTILRSTGTAIRPTGTTAQLTGRTTRTWRTARNRGCRFPLPDSSHPFAVQGSLSSNDTRVPAANEPITARCIGFVLPGCWRTLGGIGARPRSRRRPDLPQEFARLSAVVGTLRKAARRRNRGWPVASRKVGRNHTMRPRQFAWVVTGIALIALIAGTWRGSSEIDSGLDRR